LIAIERLCAVIGGRLLADIRQYVLVDAAKIIYPHCSLETQNRKALMLAGAILHYAAENDLCPYIRVKKLEEKEPEPRAMRKEDAARLIAAADGKLRFLLIFLFAQGWRISDALRLQWQDINFAEAEVRHHIFKTDKWRETPLPAQGADPQIGRVFPWGDQPLSCSPAALPESRHSLHPTYGQTLVCDVVGRRGRVYEGDYGGRGWRRNPMEKAMKSMPVSCATSRFPMNRLSAGRAPRILPARYP
jgi:hypothetical protein